MMARIVGFGRILYFFQSIILKKFSKLIGYKYLIAKKQFWGGLTWGKTGGELPGVHRRLVKNKGRCLIPAEHG